MKVFISWSGELSKQVAKELSEWLPSIIQSVEVFYSPEDIKKGENWDAKLTKELEESKYGIVCLTKENVVAPWIHFEAGALSTTLDSRVSALMVDVVTSEIQGPLSRFQATKLEKEDFYKLVSDINDASDVKISDKVLNNSFEAIWDKMYANLKQIIQVKSSNMNKMPEKSQDVNIVLEELLQLVRKQDSILSNPEKILPLDYFEYISRNLNMGGVDVNIIHNLRYFCDESMHRLYRGLKNGDTSYYDVCLEFVDFVKRHDEILGLEVPSRVYSELRKILRNKKMEENVIEEEKNV